MYICAWLFAAGHPPVRHTCPARAREIPMSDKVGGNLYFYKHNRDYTNENGPVAWTRLENYGTLESRIYLRLVHSPISSIDAFSDWCTNMLNFEIFFGFMVLFSVALLDRGKLCCTRGTSNGEQAINSLPVNTFE